MSEQNRNQQKKDKKDKKMEKFLAKQSKKPINTSKPKSSILISKNTGFSPKEVEEGKIEFWEKFGLYSPENVEKYRIKQKKTLFFKNDFEKLFLEKSDENLNILEIDKRNTSDVISKGSVQRLASFFSQKDTNIVLLKEQEEKQETFVMAIPPPNITGSLHIGHALMLSIQDALVRNYRMSNNALYIPGTDHAGIATQTVVYKKLLAESDRNKCIRSKESLSVKDSENSSIVKEESTQNTVLYGLESKKNEEKSNIKQTGHSGEYVKTIAGLNITREEFLQHIFEWKNEYGNRILSQMGAMGTSIDSSRLRFTMDEQYSQSVIEAFHILYNKGKIFRDNRMINWCSKLKTVVSDLEVDAEEVFGSLIKVDGSEYEFGYLYEFKYPIVRLTSQTMRELLLSITKHNSNSLNIENMEDTQVYTILIEHIKTFNVFYIGSFENCESINITTTRPETILGDTAVCLNPEDKRFDFTNCFAVNPCTRTMIPIIYDKECDVDFGTGALKITPSHDFVDFNIAKRNSLRFITVINEDNKINTDEINELMKGGMVLEKINQEEIKVFGALNDSFIQIIKSEYNKFNGLKRYEARLELINQLKANNLFVEKRKHQSTIPLCSRSKDVIEPRIKKQWFLDCKEMGQKSIKVVEDNEIEIIPAQMKKTWNNWLVNIRDWCLSRQLIWGHRIPAFRIFKNGKKIGWIVGRNNYENIVKSLKLIKENDCSEKIEINTELGSQKAFEMLNLNKTFNFNDCTACEKLNIICENDLTCSNTRLDPVLRFKYLGDTIQLLQDDDVLDTWFSAGLWPFAILGWPKQTKDFQKYFPTSILETGYDILFFWVARMVMLSIELIGKVPFKKILLHGIVRDAHGKKMSKSLGNVIDPLCIIKGISLKELEDQLTDTLTNGYINKKEYERALKAVQADFPNGIQECGADALRFALCSYVSGVNDINLDIKRVEGYRKLCNKIWNASKFIDIMKENMTKTKRSTNIVGQIILDPKLPSKMLDNEKKDKHGQIFLDPKSPSKISEIQGIKKNNSQQESKINKHSSSELFGKESVLKIHNRWIITRRNLCIENVKKGYESFNFMLITQSIHQFFLNDFCDVYIEIVKNLMNDFEFKILQQIFIDILKLFHPFMPFITEELFQKIFDNKSISIMIENTPEIWKIDTEEKESDLDSILNFVKKLRSNVEEKKYKYYKIVIYSSTMSQNILETYKLYSKSLLKGCSSIEILNENLSNSECFGNKIYFQIIEIIN